LRLEVLSGNDIARKSYQAFGFNAYELDPATGTAMFWEKPLYPTPAAFCYAALKPCSLQGYSVSNWEDSAGKNSSV
jgi:hypothetical protein